MAILGLFKKNVSNFPNHLAAFGLWIEIFIVAYPFNQLFCGRYIRASSTNIRESYKSFRNLCSFDSVRPLVIQ